MLENKLREGEDDAEMDLAREPLTDTLEAEEGDAVKD